MEGGGLPEFIITKVFGVHVCYTPAMRTALIGLVVVVVAGMKAVAVWGGHAVEHVLSTPPGIIATHRLFVAASNGTFDLGQWLDNAPPMTEQDRARFAAAFNKAMDANCNCVRVFDTVEKKPVSFTIEELGRDDMRRLFLLGLREGLYIPMPSTQTQ